MLGASWVWPFIRGMNLNYLFRISLLLCFMWSSLSLADELPSNDKESQLKIASSAWESLKLIDYEVASATGFVTYLGLRNWEWGTSQNFKFHNEGWFSFHTGSGGHDKLGHFYSSYIMAEFFYASWHRKLERYDISSIYPGLFSWMIMFYVEVFDGYSVDHGFSYEDLISNSLGISFAMARSYFPALRDLVDFRLEYDLLNLRQVSHPITDYMRQKYHLIFKGAGMGPLKNHWLGRYLEFGLGYYARGFKESNKDYRTKTTFVSLGINLDELFFKPLGKHIPYGRSPKYVFDYLQLPSSYLSKERQVNR